MYKQFPFCFKGIALIYIAFAFASCSGIKNINYFQDVGVKDTTNIEIASFKQPTIQPDDILSVSIFTLDPISGAQINQLSSQTLQNVSGTNGQTTQASINGFLVDKSGDIELPNLGKVKLLGLTTNEASDHIRDMAKLDFKKPSVQVRFANFKVTVMGEVVRPAMYTLPNEKVTVLDVLSLAGDLTIYGKRENVMVIREKNGKKDIGRLDLYSTNIFKNPYYYLKQNDIIYIQPDKAKAAALNAPGRANLGLILSAISVIALAFSRVF